MHPASRSLLLSVTVATAGLALADVAYAWYCERHFVPAQTLERAVAVGDGCAVTLGDSRMAAGIDDAALSRALPHQVCVASLGIGAVGAAGQSMALRRYLEHSRKPSIVILGTSAGALLPAVSPPDPSEMVGNRAIELGWSEPGDLWSFYGGVLPERYDAAIRYGLNRTTALGAYASLTWFKAQRLQDALTGGAARPMNRFGAVDDMSALATTFATETQRSLAQWDGKWELDGWITSMGEGARAAGARFVLVDVPMQTAFRQGLAESGATARYQRWLLGLVRGRGWEYRDLSAVIPDGMFDDGVHLNREGARIFSAALGSALND